MERRCVNPLAMIIPVNGSLSAGYEAYVKRAERSAMDYGFHMAITKWDDTVSKEMEVMVKEKGINSFKFFMAYKGSLMINDELLLEGFKKCKSLGALAMVHAENGDVVFEGQKRMIELGITGPEGHACTFKAKIEYEEKIEVQMRTLNEVQKQTLEKLRAQHEAFQ